MQTDKLIGTIIADRYELISLLGKGRSGVVYRARHKQLQRIVAIKIIFHSPTEDANSLARFQREAVSAAILHHPNIVTIYDLGMVPGEYAYIVMEFLEGMDLMHVFGTEGRLPLSRAVRICTQICSALSHAHNKAVIHRDLKPGNVMLQDLEDYPDFVKLVDFGLAKQVKTDGEVSEGLTMDGQVFGTPAYMSPEQCQGKKLDGRSDIYSLGCMAFKMLSGAMPITGTTIVEIMHGHVHTNPFRFDEVFPDGGVPLAVQNVIYKALSKDPDHRQQTMTQFRLELLDAVIAHDLSAPLSIPVAATPEEKTTQDRVLNELQKAAQAGNPQSQYELAVKMEHGEGIPLNKDGAMHWLKQAAQSGNAQAQNQMGHKLIAGDGCVPNKSEALIWLQKAADQGLEQAAWKLANCLEQGEGTAQNLPDAIAWYKALIARGNRQAEDRLVVCYKQCLKDGIAAEGMADWIKKGASANDPEAMYLLSTYLQQSNHPKQSEILEALTSAAQLGHQQAQYELGVHYLKGQMMPRNDLEGVRWLKAASDAGHLDASIMFASCLMSARGVTCDPTTAAALLQNAVQKAHPVAKALMGCMMLTGDGAPRNMVQGAGLLTEAANSGDAFAQWKLALCHKSGIGAVRDAKKCDMWFAKSAEGGFNQGPMWPWSTPHLRFEEALQYFQSGLTSGNAPAVYWLGICLEKGYGIAPDLPKALDCYRRAAQRGVAEAQPHAARLEKIAAPKPVNRVF